MQKKNIPSKHRFWLELLISLSIKIILIFIIWLIFIKPVLPPSEAKVSHRLGVSFEN